MMTLHQRANRLLDPAIFAEADLNVPKLYMPAHALDTPDDQYVLRMMISNKGIDGITLPYDLAWLLGPIRAACFSQKQLIGKDHPFIYVTVRSGIVRSVEDDEWHVDGFSMRVPHEPEQNYVWSDSWSTEILKQRFHIPSDFDPMVHNIHKFFQDCANERIVLAEPDHMHLIDPYVVHRRPYVPLGTKRCFFRISFVPLEIEDDSHTPNPLLPTRKYGKNGVAFRNTLKRYGA